MPRTFHHERVDSTNERALAALAAGEARDGDVHLAREQEAGRGRLGRRWESAPGEGLYLSLVHLPPAGPPPVPAPPLLTMAAGLAVLRALRAQGLEGARLDWPNDVVLGGAKLAGILIESRGFDPARPAFVIGVGVNVLQRRFPDALRAEREVTSLALAGCATTPADLAERLAPTLREELEAARQRPGETTRRYLEATGLAGARVEVRLEGEAVAGRLARIDPVEGLGLATEDGDRRFELAHVRGVRRL